MNEREKKKDMNSRKRDRQAEKMIDRKRNELKKKRQTGRKNK
jgi:hypothetical protein